MSSRGHNYLILMDIITKYEYKYKKPMIFPMLEQYIIEALKVSCKTAREYIKDLEEMRYITINSYRQIVRID